MKIFDLKRKSAIASKFGICRMAVCVWGMPVSDLVSSTICVLAHSYCSSDTSHPRMQTHVSNSRFSLLTSSYDREVVHPWEVTWVVYFLQLREIKV